MDIWTIALTNSLNDFAVKVAAFLPNLLAAIIVFLIGLLLADAAYQIVKFTLEKARIDQVLDHLGVKEIVRQTGFEFNVSELGGWIIKWFIIIIFLIAVANALNLPEISQFINEIALYLPNVIAAAVIFTIGIVISNLLSDVVKKAIGATGFVSAPAISSIVKWSVMIFVVMAVLSQLKIAANLIETLFTGIVAALALALGLAFGLGGKGKAKEIIDALSKEVTKKK